MSDLQTVIDREAAPGPMFVECIDDHGPAGLTREAPLMKQTLRRRSQKAMERKRQVVMRRLRKLISGYRQGGSGRL